MEEEYKRYRREQAAHYLDGIHDARRRVLVLELQVQDMRDVAAGLRGIDYTRPHVDSSPSDSMPDAVAGIVAAAERYEAEAAEYTRMIDECGAALDAMGGWQADLLRAHYLGGVSLADLGRSPEWRHDKHYMSRLHSQALCDFYDHVPRGGRDPVPRAV